MSNRYHVNKVSGRTNICRALVAQGCPLGADAPHFSMKEEAKAYIEKSAANDNEVFTKVSKSSRNQSNSTSNSKSLYDNHYARLHQEQDDKLIGQMSSSELSSFRKLNSKQQELVLDYMREESTTCAVAMIF